MRYYTIRDFYTEEGRSLRMSYKNYWKEIVRYREPKFLTNSVWNLHKKLHRINGWHKLDVLHSRIGKCYSISIMDMAKI